MKASERDIKEDVRAVVEIQKQSIPFGPPIGMRFSPEELKQVVTLAPLTTVKVGEYFYMQIFENTA